MFIESIKNELNQELQFTEKGALGYVTSGQKFVDFNFKITSYRDMSDMEIIADFIELYQSDPILSFKMLFFARDIRGGLGERRLFRVILKSMAIENPLWMKTVLHLVPEYGRWDDVFVFFDTPVEKDMLKLVDDQLSTDIWHLIKGGSLSLLGKWMPSINTSSRETVALAKKFVKAFDMNERQYRKMLAELRKALRVVERDLTNKQYQYIDYATVPSQAHMRYRNVFRNKDTERYENYLEALEKGETTIKAGTLAPYEIWHKYNNSGGQRSFWDDKTTPLKYDETLEQLWKNLPDEGDLTNTLVVADGSGSMTTTLGKTEVMALDVAQSLAVYFGERCEGQFQNSFITFSSKPQLVQFGNGTLKSKMEVVNKYTEVSNTNVEAVFNLILQTALNNEMEQKELPEQILIISDMEFDSATYDCYAPRNASKISKALFQTVSDKFAAEGYIMPKLIFWNICSRSLTIPMQESESGVILISGFNTAAIQAAMTGLDDPFEAIKQVLNGSRYEIIEELLSAL